MRYSVSLSRASCVVVYFVLCLFAAAYAHGRPVRFTLQSTKQSSGSPAQTVKQPKSQKVANPLNELLDAAQQAIDRNEFDAAIAPLQKVLREQPDFAYAHFQLAYAFTALKRTDEARAEYERAIALDPKMAEAQLNLGILLLDTKDYAAAITTLRKAVELLPSQSRPRALLAVAQDRSGDEAGATQSFAAVLNLDSQNVMALNYLGWAALRKNNPAEAETKFRRALEVQPQDPGALQGLARTLDAEKKPETAAAYREYLSVSSNDAEARARLVHLLIEQEQYQDALTELDRADAGKQPSLDSLRLRADIQVAQQKLPDAIATLQQAVALAPADAKLLGGLGRLYLQHRDFAPAEKNLKAALQIDRNNLVYWKDLSATYYLSGNYAATLATLDVIAKVETPAAGAWFVRALCYDKLHQTKPALEAYEKFMALEADKSSNQFWQAEQRSKVLRRLLEGKR